MREKKNRTGNEQEQKVVLITGGGSGLGRNLVDAFYAEGYKVAFTYRKQRDEIAEKVKKSKGNIIAIMADASDFDQVKASVEEVYKAFGRIDVLVNNAASAKDSTLENSTPENFEFTLKNVLYPVYYYSKVVADHMIRSEYGKIINIGSVNGIHGREGSLGYSTAKAGVIGLTKTMAKELGKYPINCNVVAPGYIATDGQKNTSELIKKLVLSECYIKRLSDPTAICNMVLFLASSKADNITGQVFQVDCGQYI